MKAIHCFFSALIVLAHPNNFCIAASKPFLQRLPFTFRGGSQRRGVHRNNASSRKTSSQGSAVASGISSLTSPSRRACGFYLWDAPAALLYRWSNHLLKDCVYEGRGGRKFVRIEPGSILQLLYPASHRYSPDRCIFCGGNFEDHVALWWAKHLYTPFDLRLDRDCSEGRVVRRDPDEIKTKKRGRRKKVVPVNPPDEEIDFLYHRRYVVDGDQLLDYAKKVKGKRKAEKDLFRQFIGAADIRDVSLGSQSMQYLVPSPKAKSITFLSVRHLVLNAVGSLIRLERFEKITTEEAKKHVPVLH